MAESEELKSLLMKVENKKVATIILQLKNAMLKKKKNEDHGIQSHHFMANGWVNSGNSGRLYFGGLQNHCRWLTAAMKLKDAYSLKEKL